MKLLSASRPNPAVSDSDAQYAMIAPRRQHHGIRCLVEDAQARFVGLGDLIENDAIGLRIGGEMR